MYKNFKINGENRIYQSLKEKEAGCIEEKWEIGDRSGITYRKYVDNIKGKMEHIDIYTAEKIPGQPMTLRIRLVDENNDFLSLELPLLDYNQEWLSEWAVSAASVLANLNKGDDVEIFTNRKAMDKSGRLYKSIYFKANGAMTQLLFKFTDCPRWLITEEVHKVTKKVIKHINKEAHDEFIMGFINKAVDKFKSPIDASVEKLEEELPVELQDNDDDLPF